LLDQNAQLRQAGERQFKGALDMELLKKFKAPEGASVAWQQTQQGIVVSGRIETPKAPDLAAGAKPVSGSSGNPNTTPANKPPSGDPGPQKEQQ
jgi:hypothetical protein